MMKTTIRRWKHGLAVRIPKAVGQETRLEKGEEVDVRAEEGCILVQRSQGKSNWLSDLMAGVTKVNRHAEADWGEPVGGEGFTGAIPQRQA